MDTCGLLCLIAAGFFGSMLYVLLSHGKDSTSSQFVRVLNPEQTAIYNNIVQERMTIYIYGLILGLLAGFTYISYVPLKNTLGICAFVVIVLGILFLFYRIHPKSDYMLNHLTTQEQNIAWVNVYRDMKNRSHIGFVLGAVAFVLFGCALKN